MQYFEEQPAVTSAEREVTFAVDGRTLRVLTDRGVFSYGAIDAGTALLIKQAPPPPATGTFLDLGCGSGAIALALAQRSPAARVIAVDVNERARELCARSAALNGLGNVEVAAPDAVDADVRFDLIWSNPPIRIGKPALHELLQRWLGCLTPDGAAVLVVQKHLGSDSLQRWLTDQGWPTDRIAASKGYRLLRARPSVPS